MKNDTLTIEEILDEEELVIDAKSPSSQIKIFFNVQEHVIDLLNYILKEPDENSEFKFKYKFPFNACEILCSENGYLIELFFIFAILNNSF